MKLDPSKQKGKRGRGEEGQTRKNALFFKPKKVFFFFFEGGSELSTERETQTLKCSFTSFDYVSVTSPSVVS